MNDAEYEAQRKRLTDLADWWIPKIGLGWWRLDLAYARDDFEVDGKPAPNTVACTTANWRYGHGCITWNMPRVAEQSDGDLQQCFVHELMHVFLNEARENGEDWLDHEERVASTLTKGFLWLRDALVEAEAAPEGPGVASDVGYSPSPPETANGPERAPRGRPRRVARR